MTSDAQVQDNWSRRLYACRDHGFDCPDGCTIVKELVPVVPREVAERLATALETAREFAGNFIRYVDDDEHLLAEQAWDVVKASNDSLAVFPKADGVMPAHGAPVSHRLSDPKAEEA